MEEGKQIDDLYFHIKDSGFFVNLIGFQDDFSLLDLEETIIDKEFDYYDYDMELIL